MNKVEECLKYQLKSFCKYNCLNNKFLNIITAKALIAVSKFYEVSINEKDKEKNFLYVDNAIYEGGLGFVSYFLSQDTNISKIELDEYIDEHLSIYCSRVNSKEKQSLSLNFNIRRNSSFIMRMLNKFKIIK